MTTTARRYLSLWAQTLVECRSHLQRLMHYDLRAQAGRCPRVLVHPDRLVAVLRELRDAGRPLEDAEDMADLVPTALAHLVREVPQLADQHMRAATAALTVAGVRWAVVARKVGLAELGRALVYLADSSTRDDEDLAPHYLAAALLHGQAEAADRAGLDALYACDAELDRIDAELEEAA